MNGVWILEHSKESGQQLLPTLPKTSARCTSLLQNYKFHNKQLDDVPKATTLPTSVNFHCHLEEYESAQSEKQPASWLDSIRHAMSTNSSDKLHFNVADGTNHTAPDLSSSFVTTTFRQKRRMSGQNWFWISAWNLLESLKLLHIILKSIELSDN